MTRARGFWRAGGLAALILGLFATVLSAPARAQDLAFPASTILVIDPNRLFAETAFGKRVEAELEAESIALAAENRRIEAELAAEEKALTDERPGMDAVTFRDKASAFDAKVRRIRAEQEAKAVKLAEENGNAQRQFFAVAQPVLQELMIESGASVMLDRRSLLLSTDAVDVTDTATRRIDAAIGDGARIVDPQPAPQPAPQPQEPEQK